MAEKLIPAAVAALAAAGLAFWLTHRPTLPVVERLPTTASAPATAPASAPVWAGRLETLDGRPAKIDGAWPQFRGPRRDNVSREPVALATNWPEAGPAVLWERRLGRGHAGAAVRDGRVYVIDHDEDAPADVLRCMSLADGRDIWTYTYDVKLKYSHGVSRTVPAVTDRVVISMGPKCHVLACDAATGKYLWHIDLPYEYGTKVPGWYAGQCPRIDGDRAILAPAGPKALMIAVDCGSGELLWTTPNPDNWKMTHSSIAAMDVGGKRVYVYCGSGGVAVVSAADGKLLWRTNKWRVSMANVPTPVPVGGGRALLTGEYNAGAMMLQLRKDGDGVVGSELFRRGPKVFGAHQHTPILYDGYLYGVRQGKQLACMTPEGEVLWASGSTNRFGIGPYLIADGKIILMDSHGLLTMAEATPDGYKPLTRAKVLPGPDSWGAMALVNGRLILRDENVMKCLDLRAK
jgi:outer membrane protein assembly factor BamB